VLASSLYTYRKCYSVGKLKVHFQEMILSVNKFTVHLLFMLICVSKFTVHLQLTYFVLASSQYTYT